MTQPRGNFICCFLVVKHLIFNFILNRQAVHGINGHSSVITRLHYDFDDREADVVGARKVIDILDERFSPTPAGMASLSPERTTSGSALPKVYASPSTYSSLAVNRPKFTSISWGRMHPDGEKRRSRAVWTEFEIAYIGQFARTYEGHSSNLIAQCLRKAFEDQYAHAIFHSLHTLDSGRLRHGYLQYLKVLYLRNSI